jgi:L-fuculose-phosphate aldolase
MPDGPTPPLVEDLCRIGRLLGRRGLIVADDGNLSARATDGTLWITTSGTRKDFLEPTDLIRIDPEGSLLEGSGSPSSEYRLHLEIYRRRDEVGAIVHAHPPIATGFAAAGEPIQDTALAEAAFALGAVPVVPYRKPGTGEVAEAVVPMLDLCWAFLLANHGAVAMGRDPEDACRRMERLEHVAGALLTARLLGGVRPLDS